MLYSLEALTCTYCSPWSSLCFGPESVWPEQILLLKRLSRQGKVLLELGALAVFNSRDPIDFEQGIRKECRHALMLCVSCMGRRHSLQATAGQGVDVVLNSLSGEASWVCLGSAVQAIRGWGSTPVGLSGSRGGKALRPSPNPARCSARKWIQPDFASSVQCP